MSDYLVIYEKSHTGYSAYVPDLPGCITTGSTLLDTRRNMAEAMTGHLSVMREFGDPMPEPTTVAERLAISVDRRPVDRPGIGANFADAGVVEVQAILENASSSRVGRVVEEVVVGKTPPDRTQISRHPVSRTEVEVDSVEARWK